MSEDINQSKKGPEGGENNRKNVVLDFFKSKGGKEVLQQAYLNQILIDEKLMSQNVFFPNQNKSLLNMFWPCEACKHLSTLNNIWPGLNSGQSVKLLTSGEEQKNINDNKIEEKNSVFDIINKIKDQMESENDGDKDQTNFYNDKNLFEK